MYEQQDTVAGQPRPGRPQKLNTEALKVALTAASVAVLLSKQQNIKTAAAIAAKVQQQTGLKVSASTVTRSLKSQGLSHLRPKVVPMLTVKQKATRVSFAKKALRASWLRVMITDSSIFRLDAMGKPASHKRHSWQA